jgi:hypothetical protein
MRRFLVRADDAIPLARGIHHPIDATDATELVWADLDRSEVTELEGLGFPPGLVRELRDPVGGYDELVANSDTASMLDQPAAGAPVRRTEAMLTRHRQGMLTVRRRLASERALFAELAQSGSGGWPDQIWSLGQRLETVIAAAQDAAEYALAVRLAHLARERRRARDLALILGAAWTTLLAVAIAERVASQPTTTVDPARVVASLLALLTATAVAVAWGRRWI